MIKFWIKIALYLLSFLFSLYGLSALDFNRLLKKNKPAQAQILYLLMAFALSYLVGSFLSNIIYYFN